MNELEIIYADIRSFLRQFAPLPDPFPTELDLYNHGLLNSLAMVSLVLHLETNYHVMLSETDLVEDNFRSLYQIAQLVIGKQSN